MTFAAGLALALAALPQSASIDWAALPPLPFRTPPTLNADMHGFAQREVRLRNCPLPRAAAGANQSVRVDVAVLIDAAGDVRVAVPRAIRCPTVEQFAAGLVTSFARNNLLPRSGAGDQWYATSLTFTWRR